MNVCRNQKKKREAGLLVEVRRGRGEEAEHPEIEDEERVLV